VKSVDATGIGSSTLTVVELQDAAGPSGTGLVYRKPDNSDCIPEIQTGDIGISYALAARVANHNAVVGCGGTGGGSGTVETIVSGTGISVDATDPANPIVTNTAPDQTIILTGAGSVAVTGTYPNFTATGSGITGTGTLGTLPVFTATGTIGNSILRQSAGNLYTSTLYNSTHALQLEGAFTSRNATFTTTETRNAAVDIRDFNITAATGTTHQINGLRIAGNATFNTANQALYGIEMDITSNATTAQVALPLFIKLDAAANTESLFQNRNASGSIGAVWSAGNSGAGTETVWVRSPSGGNSGSKRPGFGSQNYTAGWGHVMEPATYGWLFRLSPAGVNPGGVNGSFFMGANGVHIGNRGSAPPFTYALDFESTGAIRIPRGTDAQDPVGASGIWRFSTTKGAYRGHNGTSFGDVYLSSNTPSNGQIPIFDSTTGMTVWTTVSAAQTPAPSSTADAIGSAGDIRYDDDYIYIKTSAGWKRSALSTF